MEFGDHSQCLRLSLGWGEGGNRDSLPVYSGPQTAFNKDLVKSIHHSHPILASLSLTAQSAKALYVILL